MKSRPLTHIAVGEEVTEIPVGSRLVPTTSYTTACGRSVPPAFVAAWEPTCKECLSIREEVIGDGRE